VVVVAVEGNKKGKGKLSRVVLVEVVELVRGGEMESWLVKERRGLEGIMSVISF
jgi:hypothetical protein